MEQPSPQDSGPVGLVKEMPRFQELAPSSGPATVLSKEGEEKRCLSCGNLIYLGATKCKECGSFQDWRRHFLEWSGVATAALAVVPLWALAAASVKFVFSSPDPDVRVAATCSQTRVDLLVANQGEKSVALERASTTVLIAGKEQDRLGRFELQPQDYKTSVVKGGDQQLLALEPRVAGALVEFPLQAGANCRMKIQSTFRGFRNSTAEASAECLCPT